MSLATATKRRPRHTRTGITLPRVDQRTVSAMRYRRLLDFYGSEIGERLTEPENFGRSPDRLELEDVRAFQVHVDCRG